MKCFFKPFVALLPVVLVLSLTQVSLAAQGANCTVSLEGASSALRPVEGGLSRHEFYEQAKILDEDLSHVKQAAKEFGVENVDSKYFVDYVDAVFRKIKAENLSAMDAGQKMAQFGEKIDVAIAKMSSHEARKSARFSVADAVVTLEQFKPEEFKAVENLAWVDSRAPFVHADDYLKYTEGYIDRKPPFSDHPWGGGILNFTDIRDGATHNRFPLQLNSHDMKHIHYGTGHPRAQGIYWKNSRSKNNLRFMLQGAIFEAVDTFQFSHESTLARYMADKLHMDLEEAMVYVARATNEDLNKLVDDAGIRTSDFNGYMAQYEGWTPKVRGDIQTTHNGKTLDQEVDEYVDRGMGWLQRPELTRYLNYSNTGAATTQNNLIHYSGRSFSDDARYPEADPGTVGGGPRP